jgi:VWFA-related protein
MRAPTPIALLLAATTVVAAAAQFRTSVDVVRVDVLVVDQRQQPVAGLTAADFALTDSGIPQTIGVRSLADADLDVLVALDTSASMRGERLDHLRAATGTLLEGLSPRDRVTLVSFTHTVSLGPADAAPEALRPRLAALAADGATSLLDATATALVWACDRDRPMLLIVFSDGRDTASWTRPDQVLPLARRSEAVVDAVVTGSAMPTRNAPTDIRSVRGRPMVGPTGSSLFESSPVASERLLTELTGLTGGRVMNGDARGGLAAVFAASLTQFRSRYEITYTSTATAPGWHAIDLDVKGHHGATVHARRGYQR